jgi:arylsulfatase A-like enzyme
MGGLFLWLTACSDGTDESTPDACAPVDPVAIAPLVQLTDRPVNVLGISIDTLRRDDVGLYAGTETTPWLDGLLQDAVVLDDLRACANWTLPGVTCTQTGQSTLALGLEPLQADAGAETSPLPPDLETLASWLGDAGLSSHLVTAAKPFSDHHPVANGFDRVVLDSKAPAERLVDLALRVAADLGESPWYLQVHFRDPHHPYAPPEAYQGEWLGVSLGEFDPRVAGSQAALRRGWDGLDADEQTVLLDAMHGLYEGELRYLDDQLARLWSALDAEGLLANTLVVIWSDHGEQFFEHGAYGHGRSLHGDEARVLGALLAPGLTPARWSGPSSQQDWVPTILEALGLSIPEAVSGTVLGMAEADRVRISATTDGQGLPIFTVDRDGVRLYYSWNGARSLHRLDEDPAENDDLYAERPDDVACLWASLEPALARIDRARVPGEPVDPGP